MCKCICHDMERSFHFVHPTTYACHRYTLTGWAWYHTGEGSFEPVGVGVPREVGGGEMEGVPVVLTVDSQQLTLWPMRGR